MCANNYVNFVSDDHFQRCVRWVCDWYIETVKGVDLKWMQRNGVDPFKMVFDFFNTESNFNNWLSNEKFRQIDKRVANKVGEFHQKLLGGVDGWTDLEKGQHPSKADLKTEHDDSIFIELKNSHNTVKGTNVKDLWDELDDITKKYPGSIAYWGWINPRDGSSGESVWIRKDKPKNERVRKIWGKRVYEMITNDANALEKTWSILPQVLYDVYKKNYKISEADQTSLSEWFKAGFSKTN